MSVVLLLIALQSSPSMCDDLSGNAKELCLTGYSQAGPTGSSVAEIATDYDATKEEFQTLDEAAEAGAEAAEAGAEAAAEGAWAAEAAAEAAAAAGEAAAAAGEAELERMLSEYRKNWQLVSISSSKSYWYIKGVNFSSVTTTSKPIWIKSDYSRDKTTTIRTAMSLMQFDCQNRKTKDLAYTSYSPDGTVIYSKEYPYSSWEYTVPDSVLENIIDAICME